jgi:hypothetical protein
MSTGLSPDQVQTLHMGERRVKISTPRRLFDTHARSIAARTSIHTRNEDGTPLALHARGFSYNALVEGRSE